MVEDIWLGDPKAKGAGHSHIALHNDLFRYYRDSAVELQGIHWHDYLCYSLPNANGIVLYPLSGILEGLLLLD